MTVPSFPDANQDPVDAGQAGDDDLIVVGIGASAGGVQALKQFFEHVPEGSGMAYVVILHLSPNYDSQLAEILQGVTKMQVTQVAEKTKVESNHVYVVPPDQHLAMEDGYMLASPNMQLEDRRAPVDIFFRTLALSHGPRAVCVILSGTGANGSMGLKRVKEAGGAAFVQNPREAEFNEMPRNSIATELVDDVLPVAELPGKIVRYKQSLGIINIPVQAEKRPEDQQHALREVFTQLRLRTGHDFTNYKRPTLLRRIERRINVRSLPGLTAYAAFIQQNPDETTALLKDLLISVTNFFRDKKAFSALETEVLPAILRNKNAEKQVRIWVAGCATGEEAYSIAMLCAEQTATITEGPKIQIFATDIDEAAIKTAREGYYTINDAADVSQERLRRFFNKEGDDYRIRREIREMILFANHNFIKDPPFSHLDLVSCRNVLIYLNHTAQERVMETFHFALSPGSFMFLGSSESADKANNLYTVFNREYHIFQKRQVAGSRAYPVPESVPNFRFDRADNLAAPQPAPKERVTYGHLHQRLLEQYAPPSLIVNETYDIVHVTEAAGHYLQIGAGEPSQNLLKLVKQELRLDLRSALYQAVQRQSAVDARGLKVVVGDHTETINILIRPVLQAMGNAQGFILVLFERIAEEAGVDIPITTDEPATRQLEEELIRLKTQLRASNENHEFQAEELKASNEELQAMNEELRSAAEELKTSKEELQSINEELHTVNQELKIKVEETTMAGNNLRNLINSVDMGTIFLDRAFRVAFFTPSIRSLFNLIPNDIGRPLSDITNKLEYRDFIANAEYVLEKLQKVELEVAATDGRIFMMRVLPYRTEEDRINGVVLTFFDITERKRSEEARYYLASVVESSEDSIITVNFNNVITSWNRAAENLYGYSAAEAIGKSLSILTLPEDIAKLLNDLTRIRDHKTVKVHETVRINKDGKQVSLEVMISPVKNATGGVIGVSTIARDITERKLAEEALRQSEEQFRTVATVVPDLLWSNDRQGNTNWYNQRWLDYTGQTLEAASGYGWLNVIHPDDQETTKNKFQIAIGTGAPLRAEHRLRRYDGQYHWFLLQAEPLKDRNGNILRWFGAATDINEVRTAFDDLRESRERMRITMESATDYAIMTMDTNGNFTNWSKGAELAFGYTEEEVIGKYTGLIFTPEDRENGAPEQELTQAITTGKADDERWNQRKDGSRFYMSGVMRPIFNEGKLVGTVKVARDMTGKKMLEQQKDEFIGIASHELKTPITSIQSYAELLEELLVEKADVESGKLATKLNAQVERLTDLINSLLDTTKISEGKMLLRKERVDLNVLAAECIEELRLLTNKHNIVFNPGDIQQLSADRERIYQVITNLLNNAIKYSPNGGEIEVTTNETPGGVQLSVRDNGIGIPKDVTEKVFERFFRANVPQLQTYPGMGLGLYIVKGIIHGHGGLISVESIEGQGTTFHFTLPLNNEIKNTEHDKNNIGG